MSDGETMPDISDKVRIALLGLLSLGSEQRECELQVKNGEKMWEGCRLRLADHGLGIDDRLMG